MWIVGASRVNITIVMIVPPIVGYPPITPIDSISIILMMTVNERMLYIEPRVAMKLSVILFLIEVFSVTTIIGEKIDFNAKYIPGMTKNIIPLAVTIDNSGNSSSR